MVRQLIGSVVGLALVAAAVWWGAGELGIRDELAAIGRALADGARWLWINVPIAVQYVAQNWHGK